MKNELAPIVLFAYNRPEHTAKTLQALKENKLSDQSTLYIFIDGPKSNASDEQIELINKVRDIACSSNWCADVIIEASNTNNGCKNSLINGITTIINKFGKVIILEDDIVTSPNFLIYMNNALNLYENYKSIFSISGHLSTPLSNHLSGYKYDVFAFPRIFIWGWATWKDRWDLIEWDFKGIDLLLQDKNLLKKFSNGGDDLIGLLEEQYYKDVDNWDVQVNFTAFKHNLLSINPTTSFVNNIGLDGSGTHSSITKNDTYDLSLCKETLKFTDFIYVDTTIANILYNNYTFTKRPLWQKIINRISRLLGGKNVFVLKKKIYA